MRSFFDEFPLNSGRLAAAPVFADYVESVSLAAGGVQRVAVPAGARFAVFSFGGDFRALPGTASSTVPSADAPTGDGSGGELNPVARRIPATLSDGATPVTHLCLWASSATAGSIAFYA